MLFLAGKQHPTSHLIEETTKDVDRVTYLFFPFHLILSVLVYTHSHSLCFSTGAKNPLSHPFIHFPVAASCQPGRRRILGSCKGVWYEAIGHQKFPSERHEGNMGTSLLLSMSGEDYVVYIFVRPLYPLRSALTGYATTTATWPIVIYEMCKGAVASGRRTMYGRYIIRRCWGYSIPGWHQAPAGKPPLASHAARLIEMSDGALLRQTIIY
ncbi:hypothetical protein DAPPUDRAFT_233717 [Daphnia pulex]|uniref:Uncharacterized protein n=1 Tax=Daphnia pulex TaxID=6669 RepID=E9FVJ4_DAPPU|nr:hypothetical protein DAPPUDRAFT_233717 [Daphnia pulex]|eukprot:EFX89094.1 hypothetical protein DAPPUDRAFT_233717 [Daphnia pulex]